MRFNHLRDISYLLPYLVSRVPRHREIADSARNLTSGSYSWFRRTHFESLSDVLLR